MNGKDSGGEEATRTLVGARPIKMLEDRGERDGEGDGLARPTLRPEPPEEPWTEPSVVPFVPSQPASLNDTGLPRLWLVQLCLRHLRTAGSLAGHELGSRLALPAKVVVELLLELSQQELVGFAQAPGSPEQLLRTAVSLTASGVEAAARASKLCSYQGPAPVSLESYVKAVKAQAAQRPRLSEGALAGLMEGLQLPPDFFSCLGPALASASTLLLHGPSGNGKTSLCLRLLQGWLDPVFVPRAVMVEDAVVRVFDPGLHQPVETTESDEPCDPRWVRCVRPAVRRGWEAGRAELSFRLFEAEGCFEAPLQVKANDGLLILDDLGRQSVEPPDLVRPLLCAAAAGRDWVPLARHPVAFPCALFLVLATHLEPTSFAAWTGGRRLAYQLAVARPNPTRFEAIFADECSRRGLMAPPGLLQTLARDPSLHPKRSFDAQDAGSLLDHLMDLCRFRGVEPRLTSELLAQAARATFVKGD